MKHVALPSFTAYTILKGARMILLPSACASRIPRHLLLRNHNVNTSNGRDRKHACNDLGPHLTLTRTMPAAIFHIGGQFLSSNA